MLMLVLELELVLLFFLFHSAEGVRAPIAVVETLARFGCARGAHTDVFTACLDNGYR